MDYMDDSQPDGEQGSAQGAADQSTDSGKTFLINSDVCPGMKAGDMLNLRVEKVLDSGEYQVSYIPEKEEEASEPDESESSDMSSAPQSDMASYMS